MDRLRRNWPLSLLLAVILGALLWGCVAPIKVDSRDKLFEIPKGTFERRMKGDQVEILPSTVRLTLGLRDVLLLRNSDTVPQVFGPVLIMPGQDFRLPFETVSENQFACSAHASGQMTVIVEPMPNPGFVRLRWRLRELAHAIRHY